MKIINQPIIRCLMLATICLPITSVSQAQTFGANIAISGPGAGADGSGFNDTKTVRDGNINTASQAGGTTNQRVSVKWSSAQNFNTVVLREAGNRITHWQLVNNDTGQVLASGNAIGAGLTVNLGAVSMKKINLVVNASAAPALAEFEVYNASGTTSSSNPASSVASSSAPSSSVRSSSSLSLISSSSSQQISSSPSSAASSNGGGVVSTYEAEQAVIVNGVVESNHSGFSGIGFVNYDNAVGSAVEWTVNQVSAGSATLSLHYANGTNVNRAMDIRVNGVTVNSNLAFNGTGAWNTWATQSFTVNLQAGANTIRAVATTANGGPNVDYIRVSGGSSASSVASSISSSASSSIASGEVLAFPGAVGFGRLATGGRGGDVYIVTNTNNSGAGSLRDAINSASGPRTIVFAVSGNIMLQSKLDINRSNLTIAGQTAPGDGITVAGYPVTVSADNIIIRYLRFRCGDFNIMAGNGKPAKGNGDLKGSTAGALDVVNASNVIIDHVSASWAIDETLSVTYSNNVTVQNSIVSESLNDSNHEKGDHGFGSLIRGNGEGGSTFYRNLYAHHDMRNPGAGSNQTTATIKGQLDFVNNVVYGWGTRSGEAIDGSRGGVVELNYINNYVVANGDSRNALSVWDEVKMEGILTFQSGNKLDSNINGARDGADGGWSMFPNFTSTQKKSSRWNFPVVPTVSAEQAYDLVLNQSGASLVRDAIDARVVQQVRNNTGRIIDSQDDVGGLPMLNSAAAPLDADRDGMPDLWELARGLNPNNANDRNGKNLDGNYTNLEVYLNSLL
jgi:hypothetical protein